MACPSWATLPKQQRWQIVSYVQSLGQPQRAQSSRQPATPLVAEKLNAAAAHAAVYRLPILRSRDKFARLR